MVKIATDKTIFEHNPNISTIMVNSKYLAALASEHIFCYLSVSDWGANHPHQMTDL